MDVEGALQAIQECQAQISYWQAQQMRALCDYAGLTWQDEFASAEIAALLKWTPAWADNRLYTARDLVTRLPATVDALQKGEIDLYKAQILHDYTLPLSPEHAAEVEERVLAKAPEQTSAQMRRRARRIVMAVDPVGTRERIEAKKAARAAGLQFEEDDMAKLWVLLCADKAAACARRVDKLARAAKFPGDTRTLNQRRADVVADLLLAPPDGASPVKVEMQVVVAATTLMDLDDHPAELEGYGPISADLARELATDATWRASAHRPGLRCAARRRNQHVSAPGAPAAVHRGTGQDLPPARLHPPGDPLRVRPHHPIPARPDRSDQRRTALQMAPPHEARIGLEPTPGTFVHISPAGRTYVRHPEPVLPGYELTGRTTKKPATLELQPAVSNQSIEAGTVPTCPF